MAIGDNTVATISTLGDDIRWEDIEAFCTQDPTTKMWAATSSNDQIATWLNSDFRHYNDTRVEEIFRVVAGELELISKDLGIQPDPANDSIQWLGYFDTYHRQLSNTGQRNKLLKKGWNRVLTRGQDSRAIIPCVPDYVPQETQQDDRTQQGGLVLAEWDEVCQDGVEDPGFDPLNDYANDAQAVHDLWVTLTGGRRFGACSDASVAQAIADQNAREENALSREGVDDVTGRAQNAVDAANASYQAGNDKATVIADGDAAYSTPL